ncbi:helix-turn-helix domain-containing protein [Alicyclobacillus tolerans]|uniref:Transcriptional regulator with XRE-family HTH domain n=2 Tax=Alicyclobacillus tolerans TaxID=90970 RepID=A0ABT9LWM1_9BACL|nr:MULTISPECIES: helix-turn-helix transcriptional regulator [Alicyclobacillus]MDP9728665.1 transcriptional regulator with XRE-family HTH domain [Alicyclobacillus tengchongensis]QRF23309.1 helix-turn-helix transcriptional regulator [Alicyclobacillus sp. TC]SHK42506.1 Helix-turn-helix [Alicyclobacillus montanus]
MKDSFGYRIRRIRQQRDWSQQELALRSGISTPHISSLERDIRQPSLEYAKRLANALGVPLTALCDNTKELKMPKILESTEDWPVEIQNLILNEEAAPYLEAAQQMSILPKEESEFISLIIDLLVQKFTYKSKHNE